MIALPPLAAEPIFQVSNFVVTNSMVNSTLTLLVFGFFAFVIFRLTADKAYASGRLAPKGVVNFFESLVEVLLSYIDGVTKNRVKSLKFLPIVGTLFFFILVSNWAGLIPGVGSVGRYLIHEGHLELIPLFRPATTDLNMTLAMAVVAVVLSHILGVVAIGFFKYANKFIKLGDLWHAVLSLSPIKIFIAVIEFLVGIIEVFSEVAKMVSLSLRLFGNVFAGEVLLTVLASLLAFGLPVPFMLLELLVGLIQAVVFSMLTLVYLTMATMEVKEH